MDIECDKCGEVFGEGFHRYIEEVEVSGEVEEHCSNCRTKAMRERGDAFADACFDGNTLSELTQISGADPVDMKNWNIDEATWHRAIGKAISMLKLHEQ
tara:strand:- start:1 stop:297 length:297 start_codon:yes stop_codon:yes gene_type:complete